MSLLDAKSSFIKQNLAMAMSAGLDSQSLIQ